MAKKEKHQSNVDRLIEIILPIQEQFHNNVIASLKQDSADLANGKSPEKDRQKKVLSNYEGNLKAVQDQLSPADLEEISTRVRSGLKRTDELKKEIQKIEKEISGLRTVCPHGYGDDEYTCGICLGETGTPWD